MAQKKLLKDDVKGQVEVCKKLVECAYDWTVDDFMKSDLQGECIFRDTLVETGKWIMGSYGNTYDGNGKLKHFEKGVPTKEGGSAWDGETGYYKQIASSVTSISKEGVRGIKKYEFKHNGINLQIIELLVGEKKCSMYAFKEGKLVYANINKMDMINELALFTNSKFSKINSILADLSQRKDAKHSRGLSNEVKMTNTGFSL